MKKYDFSVAVMKDGDPIIFLYTEEFNEYEVTDLGRYKRTTEMLPKLRKIFPTLEWEQVHAHDEHGQVVSEYEAHPDKETDTYILAILQAI